MMRRHDSTRRSIWVLWVVVIILLIVNTALLFALNQARLTAVESLDKVETILKRLSAEVIVYNVAINQAIPVKTNVPINQTISVPINTVIPIDQKMQVPFDMLGNEVLLDVPLKVDFPIETTIPVDFNETINVDTVVELNTSVPVEIAIGQTSLAGYLQQAQRDVVQLRNQLSLSGDTSVSEDMPELSEAESKPEPETIVETNTPADETANEAPPVEVAPAEAVNEAADAAVQNSLGMCTHAYWPLQPGTTWTYNSLDSSYTERVDSLTDNSGQLSTQYEGRDMAFSLVCSEEGLGGAFLGDMRRLSELGQLTFDNPEGVFLPRVEVLEQIGQSWQQEFKVAGTVEAKQSDQVLTGQVSQGRAVAVYTPIGFETLETPLGPQEALRVEQKLDLNLEVEFELGGQLVPATQMVNLTNTYWFVKGIGLAQLHWQGGTIKRSVMLKESPVDQQDSIAALSEDQLVFVCLPLEGQALECKQKSGVAQTDLSAPATSELAIPGFILPVNLSSAGVDSAEQAGNEVGEEPSLTDTEQSTQTPDNGQSNAEEGNNGANNEQAELLNYAAGVKNFGEQISEAAQAFGEAALKYRNDTISLAEFQSKFQNFAPRAKQLIDEIEGLNPPPAAQSVHQKLVGGLAKCNQAIELLDSWFENSDGSKKETGMLLVADCTQETSKATSELSILIAQSQASQ